MATLKKFDLEFAVVVGGGEFPYDMLRYDRCFPYSEQRDAAALGQYGWTKRAVVVARYHGQPGSWTPARWESFGWQFKDADRVDPLKLQSDLNNIFEKERAAKAETPR